MHSQHILVPALICGLLFGHAARSGAADPVNEANTLVATASKVWYKHYTKVNGEFSRRMAARLVLTANTPLEKLMQAEAYRYFNRHDKSWKIYNELTDQFPNSAMLHCHIAMAFLEAGEEESAALTIANAERTDPHSAYVFAARGALLQAQEQREAAFEQYTEALRRNPYIYGLRGRRMLLAWLSEPNEPPLSDLKNRESRIPQFSGYKWRNEIEYSILEDPRLSAGFPWRLPTDNPPAEKDDSPKATEVTPTEKEEDLKPKKGDPDDFRIACQQLSRGNVLEAIGMLEQVADDGWRGPIGQRRIIAHLAIGDYDAVVGDRLGNARAEGGVLWIDGKLPYQSYSDYLTAEWRDTDDAPRIKQLIREGRWDVGFHHTPTYAQIFDNNPVGHQKAIEEVLAPFSEQGFPAYEKLFAEDQLRLAWEKAVAAKADWYQSHKPDETTGTRVEPTYTGTEIARRHLMLAAQSPSIDSSDPIMKDYRLLDPAELSKSATSLQYLAPIQLRHYRTRQELQHDLLIAHDREMLALYKEILRPYYGVRRKTQDKSVDELLEEFMKKSGAPIYAYAGHFASGLHYGSGNPNKAKIHFAKAATTLKLWDRRKVNEQELFTSAGAEEIAHWDWDPVSRAHWNRIDAQQKKLKELPEIPQVGPYLDRTSIIEKSLAIEPEPTPEEKLADELRLCDCASCRLLRVKLLLPDADLLPPPTGFTETEWWVTAERNGKSELWSLYVNDERRAVLVGVRGSEFRNIVVWFHPKPNSLHLLFDAETRILKGQLVDENTLTGDGLGADGEPVRWVAYRRIKRNQPPPAPIEKNLDGAKIAGTTWKFYPTRGQQQSYTFQSNHTIEDEQGKPLKASRWISYNPSVISFSINNHFATYEGRLLDADTMIGDAGSTGVYWNWFAVRAGKDIKVPELEPDPDLTLAKSDPEPESMPERDPRSTGKTEPPRELRPIEKKADVAGLAGSRWWVALERSDETTAYEFTLNDDYTASVSRTSWHNGSLWTSESKDDIRLSLINERLRLEGRLVEANAIKGIGKESGKPLTWTARRIVDVKETPAAPSKTPVDVAKLGGTVWSVYTPGADPFSYMFRQDNTLAEPDGEQVGKSRWSSPSQQVVRFSLSDDFARYEGKLVDKNTLVGTAGNGKFAWSWMALRQESQSPTKTKLELKPEPPTSKPGTEPRPIDKTADIAGVAGSKWWVSIQRKDETDTRIMTINGDFTVSVRMTSWHKGSLWTSPAEDTFIFTVGEGRARYDGKLSTKNRMAGSGNDLTGEAVTWQALRIHEPGKSVPNSPDETPSDAGKFAGSTWEFFTDSGARDLRSFHDDYTVESQKTNPLYKPFAREESRWVSPEAGKILISFNKGGVVYEGHSLDENTLVGSAGVKSFDRTFAWMARRVEPAK